MRLLGMSIFALLWAATAAASAETAAPFAEMAGRCWATHVLQGELVRPGTRTAEIAAENATFWRLQAATNFQDGGDLESYLSTSVEGARAEGGGFMTVALNAATCQTLRSDIEPGYDPVRQNSGN